MALVKISKQLIEEAEKQVLTMRVAAQESGFEKDSPERNPRAAAELVELAMKHWFSAAPEVRALIPPTWLVECPYLFVEVIMQSEGRTGRVHFGGPFRVPQSAKPSYADPTFRVSDNALTPETREAVVSYFKREQDHRRKYDEVQKQVAAYLSAAVSLNDAVKRFPAITAYIPKQYLDKLAEKKAKAESKAKAVAAEGKVDKMLLSVVGALHHLGS